MRKEAIQCGVAFMTGLVLQIVPAIGAARAPAAAIDHAVIAALPAWHGNHAQVLVHLDLSRSFATGSQWTLVVAQDPVPPADPMLEDRGPIAVCFVEALSPHCSETYGNGLPGWPPWYPSTYHLLAANVVYVGSGTTEPLLLLKTCSEHSMNGNCDISTVLYKYEKQADRFLQVFSNDTGHNNNQNTRFVERGPLRGDVIVDYPTDDAPYTYWVEIYAPGNSGKYARILRYRGRTGYGDHNPLAVADSEMPEILGRLGLWRPGDALPVPAQMPEGCTRVLMRNGEEWCQSTAQGGRGNQSGAAARR